MPAAPRSAGASCGTHVSPNAARTGVGRHLFEITRQAAIEAGLTKSRLSKAFLALVMSDLRGARANARDKSVLKCRIVSHLGPTARHHHADHLLDGLPKTICF